MGETFVCSHCGQTLPISVRDEFDGRVLCESCLDMLTAVCDHCETLIWRDDDCGDSRVTLCEYYSFSHWTSPTYSTEKFDEGSYLEEVMTYGLSRGVPESELHLLIDAGYDAFDIEEMLFDPALRQSCVQEIVCDYGVC